MCGPRPSCKRPLALYGRGPGMPGPYMHTKQPPGFSPNPGGFVDKILCGVALCLLDFLLRVGGGLLWRRPSRQQPAPAGGAWRRGSRPACPRSSGSSCQGKRAADGGYQGGRARRRSASRAGQPHGLSARCASRRRSRGPAAWPGPAAASARPESCRRSWRRCPARWSACRWSSAAWRAARQFRAGTCSGQWPRRWRPQRPQQTKPTAQRPRSA